MNIYKITFTNNQETSIKANLFKSTKDGDAALFYKKVGFFTKELIASFTQVIKVEKTN